MRILAGVLLSILLAGCSSEPAGVPEPDLARKPNIVVILADDLGYGDLGITGAPDIKTPNIDLLAREGVVFDHAYSNAPVCSPTRAALLSGMYQQRTGIDRVLYVDERDLGLDPSIQLLPEFLTEAGYATGIIGKWHLGYIQKSFPTRFGFEAFIGFLAGNIDYFAHTDRLGNPDLWNGEEPITDDRYMTDLIADEANAFLSRHVDDPFFLYLPFNAPHDPFQGPKDRDSAGDQVLTRQTYRTREKFKEMVEALDENVGEVIAHLKKTGLADNTIVFFMSDNGGLPIVARNAPFSGFKTELWEGGIRTTLIAWGPGRLEPGRTVSSPVIGMDLFPTVLEIAAVTPPEDRKVDGVSLAPLLWGEQTELEPRTLYFSYQDPGSEQQRAVLRDDYKYLRDKTGQEYLFNISQDKQEKQNLAAEHPEKLAELEAAWESWNEQVRTGAPQLPTRE
ncbi:MAG: sulfatase-like hydrolase/transferase [Bryobacterales bacterium]